MEFENDLTPLKIVEEKQTAEKEKTEEKRDVTLIRLKSLLLVKLALLADIILHDKELTVHHLREVTQILGNILKLYDV